MAKALQEVMVLPVAIGELIICYTNKFKIVRWVTQRPQVLAFCIVLLPPS